MLRVSSTRRREAPRMLYVGLDLSRKRVDYCVLDERGVIVEQAASPADGDGLRHLARRLAPLACKTDRIDAWVLAELCRRELVPAIWLPDQSVRQERERARFRLHLVKHRSALKNRIHQTLVAFGTPCPVSDLFGAGGRPLLARLAPPQPWAGPLT